MKLKRWVVLSTFLVAGLLMAGSKKKYKGKNCQAVKKNRVKLVVKSNTPSIPVRVSSYVVEPILIKDFWEISFCTKDTCIELDATCTDKTVLLTLEVFVNGRLRETNYGNGYVRVALKLDD